MWRRNDDPGRDGERPFVTIMRGTIGARNMRNIMAKLRRIGLQISQVPQKGITTMSIDVAVPLEGPGATKNQALSEDVGLLLCRSCKDEDLAAGINPSVAGLRPIEQFNRSRHGTYFSVCEAHRLRHVAEGKARAREQAEKSQPTPRPSAPVLDRELIEVLEAEWREYRATLDQRLASAEGALVQQGNVVQRATTAIEAVIEGLLRRLDALEQRPIQVARPGEIASGPLSPEQCGVLRDFGQWTVRLAEANLLPVDALNQVLETQSAKLRTTLRNSASAE